jgi:ABC-type glycerol-3-phosphate transport system substrate-binding protein
VVKTSEDGEILEKAEIFDYAQVQRMIAMRKARAAAKLRYEKELRKKHGVVESEDEEDDANKKKNRKKKEKPKPESLEAIAKKLAEQEIRDKTRDEYGGGDGDDTEAFGESTTSSDDEDGDGNSDTESDFDEKEARRKIESHDKLLKLHVKNLQKAEKKNVVESLGTKLARVFRRRNAKDEK